MPSHPRTTLPSGQIQSPRTGAPPRAARLPVRWRFLICADDLVLRHGQTSDAGVKQRIATAYEQRTGCTLEERIQQRISGVD